MKKAVKDLLDLLKNDPRLNADADDKIRVKTFCRYEDRMIPAYPAISLVRRSKSSEVKSMPAGYVHTFTIDINCQVQEFARTESGESTAGFDNLDKMSDIIENILRENPKITPDKAYYDSRITGTQYSAWNEMNCVNYQAIIRIDIKRKQFVAVNQ